MFGSERGKRFVASKRLAKARVGVEEGEQIKRLVLRARIAVNEGVRGVELSRPGVARGADKRTRVGHGRIRRASDDGLACIGARHSRIGRGGRLGRDERGRRASAQHREHSGGRPDHAPALTPRGLRRM